MSPIYAVTSGNVYTSKDQRDGLFCCCGELNVAIELLNECYYYIYLPFVNNISKFVFVLCFR